MALIPAVQLVSVGAGGPAAEEQLAMASAALTAAGLPPPVRVFVGDDERALERALASEVAVAVIVVAGPGGSGGDIVRRTIARVTGAHLVGNEGMLVLETGDRAFVVLSARGVEGALAQRLTSYVQARLGGRGAAIRTLRVTGPSLAAVEARLAPWLQGAAERAVEVTTLASDGEVWVRLRARDGGPDGAAALRSAEGELATLLGEDCYGRDGDTLEVVVGALLAERKLTLAVAESCTGGLLGHRLTSVPGSSRYFERGVMVYSNRAKEELLGVPAEVLRVHGAVSAPCAEAMAAGMRRTGGTDCALAVTGIAGPDGGTPTKPVGTVFIGVAVGASVEASRFHFAGDRAAVKWQSAQAALDLLRRKLLAAPEPRR